MAPRTTAAQRAAAWRVAGYWLARRVAARPGAALSDGMAQAGSEANMRIIAQRMAEGFDEKRCMQVVEGLFKSSFHMGGNRDGAFYDSIRNAFKGSDTMDRLAGLAERSGGGAPSKLEQWVGGISMEQGTRARRKAERKAKLESKGAGLAGLVNEALTDGER